MTVHIISVGDSLLDHMEHLVKDPDRYFKGQRSRANAIVDSEPWLLLQKAGAHRSGREASAWLASALAPDTDQAHSPKAAERLTEVAMAIAPKLWPASLSAELDTFDRMPRAGRPLSKKDIAVLVCSDTARGLLAGMWNATALVNGDLGKVRHLVITDWMPSGLRGTSVFVRVRGLDASNDDGFREAMRELGLLVRGLLDSGEVRGDEPFRFHLSGGFKASIPYLIGVAEGLRSLNPDRDVQACVLYELSPSSVIRLPLRRLIARAVRNDLDSFLRGTRDTKPEPGLLEGYAYDYDLDDRKWKLTPFGEGLKALFGSNPEALP